MAVMVTINQPMQAPQRFVEHTSSYQLDSGSPDPELKKLLPLIFASLEPETDHEEHDYHSSNDSIFDQMFVDNFLSVKKSVGTQKVLPIPADNVTGISTYFSRYHRGIDYRAKIGTTINSILPGTVNEVGYERGGYGRYVVIVHNVEGEKLFSLYAHLKVINVKSGETVDVGDKIGEVGLTGHTTGPHLHFELHDSKTALDPMRFFGGSTIAMGL